MEPNTDEDPAIPFSEILNVPAPVPAVATRKSESPRPGRKEPNGYWAGQAGEHWKRHLPNYYKSLVKAGTLEQTLQKVEEQTVEKLDYLTARGLYPNEAMEFVSPETYLYTPEKDQEPLEPENDF